jgi:hypothetical protein
MSTIATGLMIITTPQLLAWSLPLLGNSQFGTVDLTAQDLIEKCLED